MESEGKKKSKMEGNQGQEEKKVKAGRDRGWKGGKDVEAEEE